MQNPRKLLVGMCRDLPEDFKNMRDRRKNYNCPLKMKRSEMGVCGVESKKEKVRTYQGAGEGGVCSARIKGGRAFKVGGGDHNLG
jgi:hypothetical protein